MYNRLQREVGIDCPFTPPDFRELHQNFEVEFALLNPKQRQNRNRSGRNRNSRQSNSVAKNLGQKINHHIKVGSKSQEQ